MVRGRRTAPQRVHVAGRRASRGESSQAAVLGLEIYETMAYWDAPVEGYPPEHRDFARVWQKAEKIVFSRTLTSATTRNTRVERDFDLEAIRKLKRESEHDIRV